MGNKSTIEKLPEPVQAEVKAAIKRGATIDDIVASLKQLGAEHISRSAVGRYAKRFTALVEQQRKVAAFAEAFGNEFADPDNNQGRLLIQLMNSIATRAIIPLAEGEEVELDGEELHFLARAVKDITAAAKTDVDREAKIRDEATKRAKQMAAEAVDRGGKAAGADAATIRRIKAEILGVEA